MAQLNQKQCGLETLKYINGAITSLRLYPDKPPQVGNAIEKAYQGTRLYLREFGTLRFGLQEGVPSLCGEPLDRKTREKLGLLTFFDHLHNLSLSNLVISSTIDRNTFVRMLTVFTATPDEVKNSGGGREFVESQGLAELFPEQYVKGSEQKSDTQAEADSVIQVIIDLGVQKDYVLFLLGQKEDQLLADELEKVFVVSEKAVDIISGSICSVIQAIQRKDIFIASPVFDSIFKRLQLLLREKDHGEVLQKTAGFLATHLDAYSLCLLFCQNFTTPVGSLLYNKLLDFIPRDVFAQLVRLFTENRSVKESGAQADPSQFHDLDRGLQRLLNSTRGKQYQALEKARALMSEKGQELQNNRVQTGITALSQGRLDNLKNQELLVYIPGTIENLLSNKKEGAAAAIVENIVHALQGEDTELRNKAAMGLSLVGERLVKLEQWVWLEKLTPLFLAWLRESEQADGVYEKFVSNLQAIMAYFWKNGKEERAEQILNTFYYIRNGEMEKSPPIRALVGRIQDKNVDLAILKSYLKECFTKPIDEVKCEKIIMQGPVAARFLIDTLLDSESRPNRIRLLKILSQVGKTLPSVILERLPDRMPWYGKRNLIRLLGETGNERHVEALVDYVSHTDLRVQREAISSIFKISGSKKKKTLLKILMRTSEKFKVLVVRLLEPLADESVANALLELLKDTKYFSAASRQELLVQICKTLGASGSSRGRKSLVELADRRGLGKDVKSSLEVQKAARQALQLIDLKSRDKKETKKEISKGRKSLSVQVSKNKESGIVKYQPVTDLVEENDVYILLQKDKKTAAKKKLLEVIVQTARAKQFHHAEKLRERLIEIDSMALTEIIKAAEIIEEEKNNALDQNLLAIWSDLYDLLTTEEFNTLYYSLEPDKYDAEETIVNRGDVQERLYFINKGKVKLYFTEKGNEMLVKTLGPGEILGADSFFNASVWTIGAGSMGNVDLSYLTHNALQDCIGEQPALEAKLRDYCLHFDVVEHFFSTTGIDRRKFKRFKAKGMASTVILNDDGKESGHGFKGEIDDISQGGISFYARISQKKNVRLLLGRKLRIRIENKVGIGELNEKMTGVIVALRGHHVMESEYSVHVEFDQVFDHMDIEPLIDKDRR